MERKDNWIGKLMLAMKEFVQEAKEKPEYEIIDILECPKTGFKKAVIKLAGRHIIERDITDIVMDIKFLTGFDKESIRALTYIATVERMSPDYSIIVQKLGSEIDEYILEIKTRNGKIITKKNPSEMSKDKELLSKFSPVDANRIGYLAGVKETVKEFQLKKQEVEMG